MSDTVFGMVLGMIIGLLINSCRCLWALNGLVEEYEMQKRLGLNPTLHIRIAPMVLSHIQLGTFGALVGALISALVSTFL